MNVSLATHYLKLATDRSHWATQFN
jgi:hypothetical protein